ncbi:MAG TPA: type II toxin-antitoxin system VapB family antitoxin [Thermoanaerobaculia bacterium]|nr:type II toxin-antitoxin system VapB family antitoxin [Thermoanaerobaculia bacterium]
MPSVKTTVDIPEEALREAMRHTGAKTKREAVVLAIEEYNRRRRLARLAGALGSFEGFPTREELAEARARR